MTVYKSQLITAKDGSTLVERAEQGDTKAAICQVTLAGAVADNDVIALCELPVEARITSIRLWADDLGTTGLFNLGFYPADVSSTDLTDADALDEDALATDVDVNAAALADVELRFEVTDISTLNDAAWELAGLTATPTHNKMLLALTASEATTAGGDISVVVSYVI